MQQDHGACAAPGPTSTPTPTADASAAGKSRGNPYLIPFEQTRTADGTVLEERGVILVWLPSWMGLVYPHCYGTLPECQLHLYRPLYILHLTVAQSPLKI